MGKLKKTEMTVEKEEQSPVNPGRKGENKRERDTERVTAANRDKQEAHGHRTVEFHCYQFVTFAWVNIF